MISSKTVNFEFCLSFDRNINFCTVFESDLNTTILSNLQAIKIYSNYFCPNTESDPFSLLSHFLKLKQFTRMFVNFIKLRKLFE